LCGILLQSAHWFRFCEGSKFAISHWLGRSPSTQCCDRTSNLATLSQLHWLPIQDRIKFKIATMTHKAIYTSNLIWSSGTLHREVYGLPLPTFSLSLVVTFHLLLEVFARQLLLFAIVCPQTSVFAILSQHSTDTWNLIFSIQSLPLPSDPSQHLWFIHDYGAL